MKLQTELSTIYLHREPVDFRKAVNGLMIIVEQEMELSPFIVNQRAKLTMVLG